MFENIGGKLKGLAYFLCWGGMIASVVGGIILISNDMILIGVLTITFGVLYSWISSWVTYAIGEIAENTENNRSSYSHTRERTDQNRTASVFKASTTNYPSSQRRCPHCGETVKSSTCEMCGKQNNLFT
jgi:hypothetical protein